MNTEAIASISHEVPSAGPAAVDLPTKSMPATAARKDMFIIVRKYVFLTRLMLRLLMESRLLLST